MDRYPKRLIEVDLPIKRISAHARREKSIRHGHLSSLHIWWARKPLSACRAVMCASLWPDPSDELCPDEFRQTAKKWMIKWSKNHLKLMSEDSYKRFVAISKNTKKLDDNIELRKALLDFIADFANWDNSTVEAYLETSRALTQAAHEALGGTPGTRPMVVDPFAGGGSIPLEALRVGADAFASDLNPVAVLLNKVVLEYIPKYGKRLADEVKKWGDWIKQEAEKELAEFYPKDPDGATPIAYLWARTIQCEGPGCGAEVPLILSPWLSKRSNNSIALKIIPNTEKKRVDFEIIEKAKPDDVQDGNLKKGSAVCPCCGYTTPVASVRKQIEKRKGGAADARLFCVVTTHIAKKGRHYRLPTENDLKLVQKAVKKLERRSKSHKGELSLIPDEPLPVQGTLGFRVQRYGMKQWRDLYSPRQLLAITSLIELINKIPGNVENQKNDSKGLIEAVKTCLSLMIGKQADLTNSLSAWEPNAQCPRHLFGRQAIPIIWGFAESVPISESSGGWGIQVNNIKKSINKLGYNWLVGTINQANASKHMLPNDAANCFFSDPPYYDAVPYADLSDFFITWLKRSIGINELQLSPEGLSPKDEECIVDEVKGKDKSYFESTMKKAMAEGRRILAPDGIGVVVFAHKSTSGWETQLQAMVDAGWTMTGSWPVDTECGSRLRAMNSAALASSVHLVCRPRENPDGSLQTVNIGDWRDVLSELPKRIHAWLPHLAAEGVVGADAIFACLGPALEIFSRYSSVEKASGEKVELREYLEHVWAAVSREALGMIFEGADASGFEEDARLTAMWLWTLRTSPQNGSEDEADQGKPKRLTGYDLEYDAARKIAQGLGVHLETLGHLVHAKGDTATLLSAASRAKYLLGKETAESPKKGRKKKNTQLDMFEQLESEPEAKSGGDLREFSIEPGKTVLDQLHQSMILFGAGRGEAVKRFLVEDGVGRNPLLWRLAQALSALYPPGTEEKRWVDGVLARKKGLGL